MSDNVINIGDLRFTHKRREIIAKGCRHRNLTLHPDGQYVTCDDCDIQITSYYALSMIVEQWGRAKQAESSRLATIKASEERGLTLKAAQDVEHAWRRKNSVPTCPHCHEAIFPKDGFGRSFINKAIALARKQSTP